MIKVSNFYNKNQFLIEDDEKLIFQSYDSTVAILENGQLILGKNWDYSNTTLRHLYKFLEDYYYTQPIYEGLHTNNKKQAIQQLIDIGYIKYDENL